MGRDMSMPAGIGMATGSPRVASQRFRPVDVSTRISALQDRPSRAADRKADIQRNDHEWVVLCSNGKTYVIETPSGPRTSAPATECSLAGIGPAPACFSE